LVKVRVKGKEFYLHQDLKKNLDFMKEKVKDDWDFIVCVDGMEGGGKSTMAIQAAFYLDPQMTIDNICFDAAEFEKAVKNAKKFSSIIYDEAVTGLYSREAMQFINSTLVKMLMQIRQKNLFIFVLIPSFFDLDRYAAVWRSRGLIHVYTKNFTRGFFGFFEYEKKKRLYLLGKKTYSYKVQKCSFLGDFTKFNPFKKEYIKKKIESLTRKTEIGTKVQKQRDKLIIMLHFDFSQSTRHIASACGVSQSTVSYIIQKQKKLEKSLIAE